MPQDLRRAMRFWSLASVAAILASLGCDAKQVAPPGAAFAIEVVSGDLQKGTVGTTLRENVTVRVVDNAGTPVPGAEVLFHPLVQGLEDGTAITDGAGLASFAWKLGTTAGRNELEISIPGRPAVALQSTALPGDPVSISKKAGDGQVASPGVLLPIAPSIRVSDAFGNGVPDVAVAFTVASGGGVLTGGTGKTDSLGVFTVGGWTLGSATGENRLEATTGSLPVVSFLAAAVRTSDDVRINIRSPIAGELVGSEVLSQHIADGEMSVRAQVTSTYVLEEVTATVGASTVPLSLSQGTYEGILPLQGQPRGPVTLIVSARDIMGTTADQFVMVEYDRKPKLAVAAPIEFSVARPGLDVAVTCTDDDPAGCAELLVSDGSTVVAQGTSQVIGNFPFRGSEVTITAKDSRGQTARRTLRIVSEPSAFLRQIAIGGQLAQDLVGDILLSGGGIANTQKPVLRQVTSGAEDTIPLNTAVSGFVVPGGALILALRGNLGPPETALFQWRNGVLSDAGGAVLNNSVRVEGDWATFSLLNQGLYVRDLRAGTDVLLGPAGNGDVAANGDVVFARSGNIARHRAGVTTDLTTDGSVYPNWGPRTDGNIVVYSKRIDPLGGNPITYRTMLHDGVSETPLAESQRASPIAGLDYEVNGGWVAFTEMDSGSRLQVWTRSPAGVVRQVSFFNADSRISALAPNGTVIIAAGARRYRVTATGSAEDIMSTQGTVTWRDGRFLVLLGRVAFTID